MPTSSVRRVVALAAVILLAPACASVPALTGDVDRDTDTESFVGVDLVALDDGDNASLREAIGHQLSWLARLRPDSTLDYGISSPTAATLRATLRDFDLLLLDDPSPETIALWLADHFEPIAINGGEVLVTGYFEPVIPGSRVHTDAASVPVYRRPEDLVTANLRDFSPAFPDERLSGLVIDGALVPYFTRRQIQEEGALAGRGLELAWVNDRTDLFFLEVQGSGAISFPDGSEMRIGFSATNGRPYRSIGRLLIEEGAIPEDQMSMQALRRYLADHPYEVSRILNHNESLVFFRELDTPPIGSLGVPVTAGRSVAVDHRVYPRGALAFLETHVPIVRDDGSIVDGPPLRRLVLLQDTGGAIRGPRRVDYFWGRGAEAGQAAGLMQQQGRLTVLVPRGPD